MDDYEVQAASDDQVQVDDERYRKYLLFRSDTLLFGASADYVMEIITNHPVTPVPLVPQYVRGIINLRGQIIPIVDTRLLLGQTLSESNCIIILNIEEMMVGIMVDTVLRMIDLDTQSLSNSPAQNNQKLVAGMCTLPDGETMLDFDCTQLLNQA